MNSIDLLQECSYGGCSAKVDPAELEALLSDIKLPISPELLVGTSTHDDAGVYKLREDLALIFTTDFFPPMVSDPYTFGRIAATNALSDIFAMGGTPLLSLNLMHYPSSRLPLEGMKQILMGGQSAIDECGAFTVGGHTIEDNTPQYGLAVVGTIHPDAIITNSGAIVGDQLILTKPLGVGTLIAGHRLGLTKPEDYDKALQSMCQLNQKGMEVMQRYGIKGATDVTGFGLIGHGLELAEASKVVLQLDADALPVLPGTLELLENGCIPGAAFRNLRYVGDKLLRHTNPSINYLIGDAQTSGGLLMSVAPEKSQEVLNDLHHSGFPYASIIGNIEDASPKNTSIRWI
ncbi:selenide, water dikinase SelD [Porphyromonadaceae bacterium W3.11]|nr:selenide, water dikinase SelD [Porphyromonadaceae bacterium W3.11]